MEQLEIPLKAKLKRDVPIRVLLKGLNSMTTLAATQCKLAAVRPSMCDPNIIIGGSSWCELWARYYINRTAINAVILRPGDGSHSYYFRLGGGVNSKNSAITQFDPFKEKDWYKLYVDFIKFININVVAPEAGSKVMLTFMRKMHETTPQNP